MNTFLPPGPLEQGEVIQWVCGVVRNLTCALAAAADRNHDNGRRRSNNVNDCKALSSPTNTAKEICTLLSHTQTNIPILLVQLVSTRPYPIGEWKSDSLALEENTCLGTMCNMAT